MWKKPLFAAMAFFVVAVAAAPLSAADRSSPIFGGAKVTTLSKADASKVTGKGNATAAWYGYLGNYYSNVAAYYGAIGNYYNYFQGYSGRDYYWNAYVYSSYATTYYWYAYANS